MSRPSSRDPFTVANDDPRADDVRALLERHLAFANAHSPREDVHALDVDALVDPDVTFVSCRDGGTLLGVAALKRLDDRHAELKSMHTAAEARGRGSAARWSSTWSGSPAAADWRGSASRRARWPLSRQRTRCTPEPGSHPVARSAATPPARTAPS